MTTEGDTEPDNREKYAKSNHKRMKGSHWGPKCLCDSCEMTVEQCRGKADRKPFVAYLKMVSLKHGEMVNLMRRNGLKIDNLKDPMQKLAFTFFSEIGELSHKADVVLEEAGGNGNENHI